MTAIDWPDPLPFVFLALYLLMIGSLWFVGWVIERRDRRQEDEDFWAELRRHEEL